LSPLSLLAAADLQQLGELVERLPTGVIMISRRSLEIVYANNAARRAVRPLRLRPFGQIPDPWPNFSLPAYVEELIESGVAAETQVTTDTQRTYVVSGKSAREANVAVVLLDDVSRQERRRRAEREFVANAAHELLTPLTGIVGAAHVLEAGAKEVPQDRDHFIRHIARECDRLTRIARSLLVLARAQSGEEPPRLEIFLLCDILTDMKAILAADDAPPITVECADDVTALIDTDLFTQALTNLIGNAAQHGSGEALEIRVADLGTGRVQIQVASNGTPVAGNDITQLGRRFHSGAGRDSGGFGLGISIAVQSIEAMGGELMLDEALGGGVTARIEIPSGRLSSS
jgi:two-component system, OmpR family, sensor histidine kinase QseC